MLNPFKKQPVNREPKRKAMRAPSLTLIQSEAGDKTLAMGMSWKAVVTDGREAARIKGAQAIARKAGATHFSSPSALFALGVGKVLSGERGLIYSAALVASQHAEDGLFVLSLPGDRVWVCLMQQGKPQGVELVALTLSAALAHIEDCLKDFPDVCVFSDLDLEIQNSIEPLGVSDLMLLSVSNDFLLNSAATQSAWSKFPLPFKVAIVILIGILFIEPLYQDMAREDKAAERRKRLVAEAEAGKELWRSMILQEYAKRAHALDIAVLRKSFDPLPVVLQGWVLQGAACDASFSGDLKRWACTASYTAPKKDVPFATNQELTIPPGFVVTFLPPRLMRLSWSVEHFAKALTQEALVSPEFHLVTTASTVQQELSRIIGVSEIRFAPIAVQAPRGGDGAVIQLPEGSVLPLEAKISVQANLQNFGSLWSIPADWMSATLTVKQDAKIDLILDMSGVLYAK